MQVEYRFKRQLTVLRHLNFSTITVYENCNRHIRLQDSLLHIYSYANPAYLF